MTLLGNPGRSLRDDAVDAFADRLDLAALHREVDLVRAGIAADQLELQAEQRGERARIGGRHRAGAERADMQLLLVEVVDRTHLEPRRIVGEADAGLGDRRAEPGDPGGVEARFRHARDRGAGDALVGNRNRGAVLGRNIVDVVGRHQSAGAGHVLRHHRGLAGQVPADMAGHRAAEQVVGAARRAADHHPDGLAREVRLGVRPALGATPAPRRRADRPSRPPLPRIVHSSRIGCVVAIDRCGPGPEVRVSRGGLTPAPNFENERSFS